MSAYNIEGGDVTLDRYHLSCWMPRDWLIGGRTCVTLEQIFLEWYRTATCQSSAVIAHRIPQAVPCENVDGSATCGRAA
jgi:hypothetical protein